MISGSMIFDLSVTTCNIMSVALALHNTYVQQGLIYIIHYNCKLISCCIIYRGSTIRMACQPKDSGRALQDRYLTSWKVFKFVVLVHQSCKHKYFIFQYINLRLHYIYNSQLVAVSICGKYIAVNKKINKIGCI